MLKPEVIEQGLRPCIDELIALVREQAVSNGQPATLGDYVKAGLVEGFYQGIETVRRFCDSLDGQSDTVRLTEQVKEFTG